MAPAPAAPLEVLLETSRGHERLWRKKGKSPTVSRRHATCTGRRKSEEAIRETGQHQPATVPGKETLICVYRLRRSQRKEMDKSSRAGTFQMRRRASWSPHDCRACPASHHHAPVRPEHKSINPGKRVH